MADHTQETPGTGDAPYVTVVIPVHNEEGGLGDQLSAVHGVLAATEHSFEIIVVDDGSTDGSAAIAEKGPCRLIRLHRNRGYGAALLKGIGAARSELIVIIDADGTYPSEEIPRLLERAQDCDMVVGSRTGEVVHNSLLRGPPRWFLRKLASYLAGTKIPDLNSGLRVLRKSLVRRYSRILPSGFSFTTTITLALLCNDYEVEYVPISYHRRVGKSKIRPSHAYHFLLLILRVIVLFNPLKVFLPLGMAAFVAGVAKFVYDVFLDNLSESAVMALLAAMIIWAVGLLADQNARLGLDKWGSTEK